MKLKYLAKLIFRADIFALLPVMADWRSITRIHFIHAGLESGLLPALAQPRTRDELIAELGVTRPEIFDALLDVGLSIGELARTGESYQLKGKRSRTVITEQGDALGAVLQAQATYYNSIFRHAPGRMRGEPDGDYLSHIGPLVARFSKLSEPIMRSFIRELVINKSSLRILEVGCGSGALLRAAHAANPRATGVGVDLDPAVAAQARGNMARWGLSEVFEIIEGDVRDPAVAERGPFDLITLYNIIYYFPLGQRPGFLADLKGLLAPGGTLALANGFQGHGKDPSTASLNLANCSIAGLWPLPELDELIGQLKQAGFSDVAITKMMPGSSFIGLKAS